MTKRLILLVIIFIVALGMRLYRFSDLSKFNYDEARDATIERQILVDHKFTLLGPETKIGDKVIYFGPLHYYLMAPALAISSFDPIGPNLWTVFLGAVTTVIIYLATRSYLAGLFYAVFPLAVIFNRWAWNPNTIPLFSALLLLALINKRYFWSGLFLAFAFQLHVLAAGLIFVLGYFWWRDRKSKRNFVFAALGFFVGISPMIIFDVRHDFLYVKSTFDLFSADRSFRGFNWHYFLAFLPVLSLGVGRLPKKIVLLVIVISMIVTVGILRATKLDMAQKPETIENTVKIIAGDQEGSKLSFNVASFVDPDTRATAYRYFLSLEGLYPLTVGEYSVSDHLYVITYEDRSKVLYNQTYEISSFKPRVIAKEWKIGEYNLFRLEK